ncbi:Uncharacterised protein [Mycobacterium tuberculosis]|uniref:Uncharacterized protein n=1 Tax=Mycobacterium tuberculosis TaxID=1773 RepID=A0A654TE97_MYCTX|nr:Uncharacterised protein [Mycobacterium tuberculosis]CKR99542.1 Uncharacterised protein [Mycobacterium tuberculosis]CKT74434.1 Uncharacterised protein [Mycobacterium tuberculosis]SIP66536.1 hypothetical protein BN9982_40059 [Mycobacterium tuberculosis]
MAPSECRPHDTTRWPSPPLPLGATWGRFEDLPTEPAADQREGPSSSDKDLMSGHAVARRATCAMDATVAWSPAAEIDPVSGTPKAIG